MAVCRGPRLSAGELFDPILADFFNEDRTQYVFDPETGCTILAELVRSFRYLLGSGELGSSVQVAKPDDPLLSPVKEQSEPIFPSTMRTVPANASLRFSNFGMNGTVFPSSTAIPSSAMASNAWSQINAAGNAPNGLSIGALSTLQPSQLTPLLSLAGAASRMGDGKKAAPSARSRKGSNGLSARASASTVLPTKSAATAGTKRSNAALRESSARESSAAVARLPAAGVTRRTAASLALELESAKEQERQQLLAQIPEIDDDDSSDTKVCHLPAVRECCCGAARQAALAHHRAGVPLLCCIVCVACAALKPHGLCAICDGMCHCECLPSHRRASERRRRSCDASSKWSTRAAIANHRRITTRFCRRSWTKRRSWAAGFTCCVAFGFRLSATEAFLKLPMTFNGNFHNVVIFHIALSVWLCSELGCVALFRCSGCGDESSIGTAICS